jgi:hypothetical protein
MIIFGSDKPGIGGYGDRIVGLVSCKVIANVIGRKFRILWTRENIRPYVNYDKYDFENELSYDTIDTIQINVIDNQAKLKYTLALSPAPFEDLSCILNVNAEISQYVYKNPYFPKRDYYHDILSTYRQLYTDIFIPTEACMKQVHKVLHANCKPLIGIQIRTGDIYMTNISDSPHIVVKDPEETLPPLLRGIKDHIEGSWSSYSVFLTSDYAAIHTLAKTVWDPAMIYYNSDPIEHMDRQCSADMSKLFVDSYILSQKTQALYISECSNFGRVAALSSTHACHFDLQCKSLDVRQLLSKHEHFIDSA